MASPRTKSNEFSGIRKEFAEIRKDLVDARKLFVEELYRFFGSKGDRIIKVYVVFVLIILALILDSFFGPFFDH